MAGTQAELLFGVLGYYIVATIILQMVGIAGPGVFIPGQSDLESASGNTLAAQATTGVLCAGSIGLGFFTLGLSIIASIFTCGAFAWTVFAPQSAVDAFHYIFAFLYMFFQVLTFQLPLPIWLNAIIVLPGAAMLIYIGIKLLRGGG